MEKIQGRFAVMGDNIFKIVDKIATNQNLCRLLNYTNANPFDPNLPKVDGDSLIHKKILIVPKLPDSTPTMENYIVAVLDDFFVNPGNSEFKNISVRFDVACHFDNWILQGNSLRPYLIMAELDKMFNQVRLSGIGKIEFRQATRLVLSPYLGGYSLEYVGTEFN